MKVISLNIGKLNFFKKLVAFYQQMLLECKNRNSWKYNIPQTEYSLLKRNI